MDRLIGPRQRLTGWLLLTVCCSASAGWAAGQPVRDGDPAPQTFTLKDARGSFKSDKPGRLAPSRRMGLDLGRVPEVRLGTVDTEGLLREDAKASRQAVAKVLRFGVGRDVSVSALDGNWYDLAGGAKLWVVEVASTSALGLRLHFSDVRLPEGAELAVYSPEGIDRYENFLKTGSGVPERAIEFFRAGSRPAGAGFWSSTVAGERARIEYYAPAGAVDSQALPFTLDRLQHVYVDPVARAVENGSQNKDVAGPCHNDVTCYPEWADVANAVAGIGFIGDDSLFCTGQLVNTQLGDFTPLFLTANHCLRSQANAGSVEVFWFYQTATCGGPRPSLTSVPRSPGATLLSTNPVSDYTLLMVEGTLPPGVAWAGWTSAPIPDGVSAAAIHHPSGDYKRISFGDKASDPFCRQIPLDNSNHLQINWTDGPTEPGSSGSGIFRDDTHQLFGQLHCGPSACGNETNDAYGSFSTTFPRIRTALTAGTDDRSEQNDSCPKARVLRPSRQAGRIIRSVDPDWYKILVPPRKTLTVTANFVHAFGDVDLKLFANCSSEPLATAEGTEDSETVAVTNVGRKAAFVFVNVYLTDDVRNNYDITVSVR
ncbi:MAG TPA: serine protease [Thermoanaerobaculia bacterium]